MKAPNGQKSGGAPRFTLEQVKKPCGGAIHSFLAKTKFIGADNVEDERLCLCLSRQSPTGVEVQFASIYLHACGLPVMHTTSNASITIKTIEEEIIPRMRDFEKAVNDLGLDKTYGDMADLAHFIGIRSGVGCSLGGCKVCNPVRKAVSKARAKRKKARK